MKSKEIRKIEALAKLFVPPVSLLKRTGAHPAPATGQIWSTHPRPVFPRGLPKSCATDDPLRAVILEPRVGTIGRRRLHLIAPIIEAPELAGPDDLLLPKELLGHRVALAVGSSITVLHSSLESCEGLFPDDWVAKLREFHAFVSGSGRAPDAFRGLDYLDELDTRFEFHERLIEDMDYLQRPLLTWAQQCGILPGELTAPSGVKLPDPAFEQIRQKLKNLYESGKSLLPWSTEPWPLAADSVDRRTQLPVISISEDGTRQTIARAIESIPLPRPDVSWRFEPALPSLANRTFAILPLDSCEPLGYGRLGARGARLTLSKLLPKKEFPREMAIVLID